MKKALGLDLGVKTLGIAASDSIGIAHGVETYRFKTLDFISAANRVNEIATERGIIDIALGYPLHLNGKESEMSKNVISFKEMLISINPNFNIELVDERLTSVSANKTLSMLNVNHQTRKDTVDTLAAIEILESYLRKKGN